MSGLRKEGGLWLTVGSPAGLQVPRRPRGWKAFQSQAAAPLLYTDDGSTLPVSVEVGSGVAEKAFVTLLLWVHGVWGDHRARISGTWVQIPPLLLRLEAWGDLLELPVPQVLRCDLGG